MDISVILSNDTRKTTKLNAFKILYDNIVDSCHMTEEIASALKTVYPETKARDIKDYWKMLMVSAGKKDVRYYLNGIYVLNETTLVSSNGHVLCRIELNEKHGLTVGALYESNKEKIICNEPGNFKYPLFDRVINKDKAQCFSFDVNAAHTGFDTTVGGIEYSRVHEAYYNNKYMKMIPKEYGRAYQSLQNGDENPDSSSHLVIIKETDAYTMTFAIMPMRM